MFSMTKQHGYGLTELEEMIPYEREFYVKMIINYLRSLEQQQNG